VTRFIRLHSHSLSPDGAGSDEVPHLARSIGHFTLQAHLFIDIVRVTSLPMQQTLSSVRLAWAALRTNRHRRP
jgi:hypothetical protein